MNTTSASALAVRDPWALVPSLGNLDAYISAINRIPLLTQEERSPGSRAPCARTETSTPAGKLVLSHLRLVVSISRKYPRLRAAARRPDPGRQRRPDEGRQAIRSRAGRAPGELRHALDQGRDPRVHPEELADGQGRDDQGAAQALLQPAFDEAEHEGRGQRRGHASFDLDAGRGRHACPDAERQARGSAGDGNPPLRWRRRARAANRRQRGNLRADRLSGR